MENEEDIIRQENHETGLQIISVLNLTLNKDGFIKTGWGPKTPEGLTLCIRKLIYGEI